MLSGSFLQVYAYTERGFNQYLNDLPYTGTDFEDAYNYAITQSDKNVILYYGKTQVTASSAKQGFIVAVFEQDVYLYRGGVTLYGYTTTDGTTRIRPTIIKNFSNGVENNPNPSSTSLLFESSTSEATIYYNKNIYKSTISTNKEFGLLQEDFQPEPTPYPTATPLPLPSQTPLPTSTPLPVISPTPYPEDHGHEEQQQYLYLTNFDLIRANRFFLAYGFEDDRIDLWQNDYQEVTEGTIAGSFDIVGYSDGQEKGHYSYSEWSRIQDEYGADYVLTLNSTGYSYYEQHFPLACRVTAVTGEAEPDEWTCKNNWDSDELDSDLYTLVVTPKAPTGQGHDDEIYEHNGLLYMEQVKSGSELVNGAGNGEIIGELHEVTNSDGTSYQTFRWKSSSIVDVTKRTRIYANVLYAPENLVPLNGLNDFDDGNRFQLYSKTFEYNSENPPVVIYLVYDGAYNSTIFTNGALSWNPWKYENQSKVFTGSITKTAKISGGGIVECVTFQDFSDGDIVGADLEFTSGIGSVQPLYVGSLLGIPDDVYALLYGITAGAANTNQIKTSIKELKDELSDTSQASEVTSQLSNVLTDVSDKGFSYPIESLQQIKQGLDGVTSTRSIRLPALFAPDEYYEIRFDIIENELPALWVFIQAVINMACSISLIRMLIGFIKGFFDFGGTNDS